MYVHSEGHRCVCVYKRAYIIHVYRNVFHIQPKLRNKNYTTVEVTCIYIIKRVLFLFLTRSPILPFVVVQLLNISYSFLSGTKYIACVFVYNKWVLFRILNVSVFFFPHKCSVYWFSIWLSLQCVAHLRGKSDGNFTIFDHV